jgi:hypothetical protein
MTEPIEAGIRDLIHQFREFLVALRLSPGRRSLALLVVVVQTLDVGPIRGLEVALDHAASTAFQISGAVLCLARSLSSLN